MNEKNTRTVIGLMSGTSLDGVDAALMRTDGEHMIAPIGFLSRPYSPDLRADLRMCFGKKERDQHVKKTEAAMTEFHAELIAALRAQHPDTIPDLIGFHGQTIWHDTEGGKTCQIGDAQLLAKLTDLDVIHDFRSADMRSGGQGAPLAPIYHHARASQDKLPLPVAILNIGGVANLTYIKSDDPETLLAFDTGPGNALMDDYMLHHTGKAFDDRGKLAAMGHVGDSILEEWLAHPYFVKSPPKSLDRNEWDIADIGQFSRRLGKLSEADAMATLLGFTVRSIIASLDHCPEAPVNLYVCGGGRLNETLMVALQQSSPCPVMPVESLNWNGDAIEAECFAYLAARSILGLPLSYPGTTGVKAPQTGGKLIRVRPSG